MKEIPDIERFLAGLPPFAELTAAGINRAARAIHIAYYRCGSVIMALGADNSRLHIVRSGAVELRDADDGLLARLAEGECFGFPSLMNAAAARSTSTAIEDTLIYHLDGAVFAALRRGSAGFDTYFNRALSARLAAGTAPAAFRRVRGATAGSLVGRPPVTIDAATSVRETAAAMVRERVSAMLVVGDGAMRGIVTDRDLRSRVVAAGLSTDAPVQTVMTPEPVTVDAAAHAYEAALIMMQHNIHHLPVTRGETLLGMVSRSDFMRLETEHPLYLVGDLGRQTTAAGLAAVCERLPALIAGQIDTSANGEQLGRFITAITDTVTRKLLEIGECELGPPPCRYAWVALGSQGRREQSAKSDQDNALVLADSATRDDDAYFGRLATIVSDGLNACGFVYCPGEIMATNAAWRRPLSAWQDYFHKWITVPEEKALMHANIFFDLRAVAGEGDLVETLHRFIRDTARGNELFLAMMARNALSFQPPLGFFRQFVLDRTGEHRNTLDLKLAGIMPVVEIARIRALAVGDLRYATRSRLRAAAAGGELNAADAASLIDALDFVETLRLKNQSRQLAAGAAPDNHLAPAALSPLARQNLKAAFTQIQTSQAALKQRFHLS